jgi:hypothetical protein
MAGDECLIGDIPPRLHQNGRSSEGVQNDDVLYVRHPPLPSGESYGITIPDHRVLNQSANSKLLNRGGKACDVLYDTRNGNHWLHYEIAKLDVTEILDLTLPNENTVQRNREGKVICPGDVYSFRVQHKPAPCMFPHCEIVALKNGAELTQINSNTMKTTIRAKFARMAEKARTQMAEVWYREVPVMRAELSDTNLG